MLFNIRKYSVLFILVIVLIIFSCKKDKSLDNSIDYSYFPDIIGTWVEYDITKIHIDDPSAIYDTVKYMIREIIESKYTDTTGNEVMRVERYIKYSDTTAWIIKDVWTAQFLNASLHKTEENIKYIKIAFPAKIDKEWNGNAYNIYDSQIYEITELDKDEIINSFNFDSVLTVTQINDSSLIHKNYAIEKFAKNIGLVYRHSTEIESDITIQSIPIEERITTGDIYIQEVINFGN